ncbi:MULTISPECIES: hypothetical protein [unclassified Mesoflavibacter]|uniref:hypothetical protein n=1 Tax=unclassified Mesoflavibacter TaxID=2630131 RepID=UPI001771618F|nr:hypothetical protein [Flavobacteriaceae bacterium]HIC32166.1 hypothetical protein [Flavobacteriaceae bacterium]
MKTKLITLSLLLCSALAFAQAITNVKTLLTETEYGNARLLVTPLSIDAHAEKPTKTSGVYAILVCFTYKGEQKAIHQDLTRKFAQDGEAELFLAMGAKKDNIVIGNVQFYRRDLMSSENYPKKDDCYK